MMKIMKQADVKDLTAILSDALSQCNDSANVLQRLSDSVEAIKAYQDAPPESQKLVDFLFICLTRKPFRALQREAMETFRHQQPLVDALMNSIKFAEEVINAGWQ